MGVVLGAENAVPPVGSLSAEPPAGAQNAAGPLAQLGEPLHRRLPRPTKSVLKKDPFPRRQGRNLIQFRSAEGSEPGSRARVAATVVGVPSWKQAPLWDDSLGATVEFDRCGERGPRAAGRLLDAPALSVRSIFHCGRCSPRPASSSSS